MSNAPVRVVHYVNQFFAGIGGEDKADLPVQVVHASHRAVPVRVRNRRGLHRHNAGRASTASSVRARAAARHAHLNAARGANQAPQSRT